MLSGHSEQAARYIADVSKHLANIVKDRLPDIPPSLEPSTRNNPCLPNGGVLLIQEQEITLAVLQVLLCARRL
jgi:hypothetical protein